MNYSVIFIWFITALLVHFFIKSCLKTRSATQNPPSPPALPFIGHLHLIGSVLPKSFQTLARRYGPLMLIRMGASTCVVVSNAAIAKEIFKTQDLNFSSRPEFGSSEYFIYRGSRFVMAQYGDYWRFMKKLCMTKLLAVPQLDRSVNIRDEEIEKLVERVEKSSREGKPCDLSGELTTLTNNMICRMAMSTRCSGNENEAEEIHELMREFLELAGKLSIGDVLGPLKMLDFSGNGKKLLSALQRFDALVERIIEEHESKATEGGGEDQKKDLMDILLETVRDPTAKVKLSRKDIKSFLLDIFMAGTDTSSAAMQWAMGHLINHPEIIKKLREEINYVVGPNRLVKESDIPNLPYLRAVIKETLRLHPSAPLIIRECAEDCQVNGSIIKAKTRVIVNVYAIMRDPNSWTNPDEFVPERFLESSEERVGDHQMEFKGQNFRYLPFGSGRRVCAGASLAMLMMHPTIGSLVQRFDWKLKDGEKVDLRQGPGFATEMANPLVCYPVDP
ncbi:Cytochrome P450 93A1 [Morella rubra]|uniref:Cytochrome P450 93A1 n=1 Tax=Morella rubra TaxID=262757 RepID=A0A6A1V1D6_9ROSI|nr:Cytochrome P450 93A1 [Morella rubra]